MIFGSVDFFSLAISSTEPPRGKNRTRKKSYEGGSYDFFSGRARGGPMIFLGRAPGPKAPPRGSKEFSGGCIGRYASGVPRRSKSE